jgi:hypothetical protein
MILTETACFYLAAGFALGMFFIGQGIGRMGEAVADGVYRAHQSFLLWLDRVHPEPPKDDDEE